MRNALRASFVFEEKIGMWTLDVQPGCAVASLSVFAWLVEFFSRSRCVYSHEPLSSY
jgi:hypothetical protein